MANAFSSLGAKKPLSGVLVISLVYAVYKARKQFKLNIQGSDKKKQPQQNKKKHKRVGVNADFFEQMKKLLPICIPGVFSKESGLLIVLASVLIARTWLDIWFSGFNG
ncbi:hypothetical protein CU098_008142, partial [Rhizopus stolonifer]